MCVIFFAYGMSVDRPLLLIANRDEFYDRPSRAAAFWNDEPAIYGGRDEVGNGTWLAVTQDGRFAAVTNYRDPSAPAGTRSRGVLVTDFLRADIPALEYLRSVEVDSAKYSGFNLLAGQIGNDSQVGYFSNRGERPQLLEPGIYGLSNHLLDTPWPKVARGKAAFAKALAETGTGTFFQILADRTPGEDNELPATGLSYEAEKALSAIFIETPRYGTRCSTVVTFNSDGRWDLEERVFV